MACLRQIKRGPYFRGAVIPHPLDIRERTEDMREGLEDTMEGTEGIKEGLEDI